MFAGSIPHGCVEQLLKVVPLGHWSSVHVAWSGAFILEQSILSRYPDLEVYGNDVSLYSCSLGKALIDEPIEINFHSRLQFIQDYLGKDAPYSIKVAAVLVAYELSKYAGDNIYGKKHFDYIQEAFPELLIKFHLKIEALIERTKLKGFFSGDWKEQVKKAAESGGGFIAFPPLKKGGPKKMQDFLDSSISWEPPSFNHFDPKELSSTIDWLKSLGIPYCLGSDQFLQEHEKCSYFIRSRDNSFYVYSDFSGRNSLRHYSNSQDTRASGAVEPFLYTPIDTARLRKKSKVEIVKAEQNNLNFIKNIYLAKGISHSFSGNIKPAYFVFIDKMLAGGIIYKPSDYAVITDSGIHYEPAQMLRILSDVCVSTQNKCSKLISMIATSRSLILPIQNQKLNKIEYITTTAFSNSKMSMKYRGIFELNSRRPSTDEIDGYDYVLQYGSKVSELQPHQLYRIWFDKYSGLKSKTRNNGQQSSSRKAEKLN